LDVARSAYTRARVEADRLWEGIKKSASRAFASPLTLTQAVADLPPGVLYVAFSVNEDRTEIFLLQRAPGQKPVLSTYPVEAPLGQLEYLTQAFREQVTDPEAPPSEAEGPLPVVAAGRALFSTLFPPQAQRRLASVRRLLISPAGPLWDVPFAALVTNEEGSPRYLGQEKAITYATSLTLFAQSRQDQLRLTRGATQRARSRPRALVVGDPVFERKSLLVATARGANSRPSRLRVERSTLFLRDAPPARLPETRREAASVSRLYGSIPLLGQGATEAAVRPRLRQADVIHLATHGFLNPVRAMSSGVLLTVPTRETGQPGDDGALQAWEIFSQVKLNAELVVLSACETGRGENVAGEGIVGLTRALQYAGARSIVAIQWKVADASTATLMVAFHRKLRQGLAKDEALSQAMAQVRSNPRTRHPYYWAPFFLTGDPDNPNLGARGKPAGSRTTRGDRR
jgi:CHAT domain-containing protein